MDLLIEASGKIFNTGAIRKGELIYAKHECWDEAKAGVVSAVTPQEIRVMYHPPIANVTQFLMIPAEEVSAGKWEIRWSADLKEIKEYPGGE